MPPEPYRLPPTLLTTLIPLNPKPYTPCPLNPKPYTPCPLNPKPYNPCPLPEPHIPHSSATGTRTSAAMQPCMHPAKALTAPATARSAQAASQGSDCPSYCQVIHPPSHPLPRLHARAVARSHLIKQPRLGLPHPCIQPPTT